MLSAPTYYLPLNIKCFRLQLRGEHPRVLSFNQMLLLCVGEAPLLDVKTQVSWFTFTPVKRWLNESSLVQGWHCNWCGCKVGELGYQWRFSEVWLLDPFECQRSVYQCLSTRVCSLWYGSPEASEDHLFSPDGQLVGTSIGRVTFCTTLELLCCSLVISDIIASNQYSLKNSKLPFIYPCLVLQVFFFLLVLSALHLYSPALEIPDIPCDIYINM